MNLNLKTTYRKYARVLSSFLSPQVMRIIPSSTNEVDFWDNFHKHITLSTKKDLSISKRMSVEEEFVGNRELNRFWITTHERMKYRQYEKRFFDGKLCYENDRIIIVGRFKYTTSVYIMIYPFFFSFMAIFLISLLQKLSIVKEMGVALACMIAFWVVKTSFAREKEQNIIELLRNL